MTNRIGPRVRCAAASVALAALGAAGCGGGDDAADTTEPTQNTSVTAPAATVPTTADARPDSTAVSEPPASAPDGSMPEFTGDQDSEFCGVAAELEEVSDAQPENPFDPEFYRDTFTRFNELYPQLVAAAPPEIAADVDVEGASFEDMQAVFADVDYNFLDVDLALLPDSPELDAAKARVDAYLDQVCGIARDRDDDAPREGTMRDLLADTFIERGATDEQAACMVDYLAESETGGSEFEMGIGVMAACGFTQPLIEEGFTEEQADCAVDYLSTADTSGSETEIGIALVAACGITQPLIDEGFTEDEAQCVVEYVAAAGDVDTSDTSQLGLDVIKACGITRFFEERGFTTEQARCMVDELTMIDDISDEDAVLDQVVATCVVDE
jgi:hypothetical protein